MTSLPVPYHNKNEFLFNLDEKFQNYDANAVRITRRDVVSLASQIFDSQGFVSPHVMQYKKLLPMLSQNNTTWDENLIGKTTVVDGEEVIDPVAKEAVARFQEWISDVPRLKAVSYTHLTLPTNREV